MEKKEYYIKGDFFYCSECDGRLGFPEYGHTLCHKCSNKRKDGLLVGRTIDIKDERKLKTDYGLWKAYSKEPLLYSQKELDELLDKAREEVLEEVIKNSRPGKSRYGDFKYLLERMLEELSKLKGEE
jgi:hypothetical protein